MLTSAIIFFSLPNFSIFHTTNTKIDLDWLDLTSVNIENLIERENILFIDITADWCATCQFNKINVLNSESIKELFKEYNVIKIRGDWTKPNTLIEAFLQKNKKFGIPLNVIYSKDYPKGIILSELLSVKEIVETINTL